MVVRQIGPLFARIRGSRWNRNAPGLASVALALGVVGLGLGLGLLLVSPSQTSVIALVSNLAVVLLTLNNPLYGLLAAVILNPLQYYFAVINLGSGTPDLTIDRIVLAVCLVLLLARVLTKQRPLHSTNINLAALLFLVAYYASFANYSWSTNRVLQFLLDEWIMPIGIYFAVSNLVSNERQVHLVLNLLLILGVYSALYMIYENVTGNVLFTSGLQNGLSFYRGTDLRITRGLYGTTTTFGNLYNLLLPVGLYFVMKARTLNQKIWYVLAVVLMLVGVYLTYKRAVWIGLILCILILQWFYPQFRKLFVLILFVAAVGMFASWDTIVNSEAVRVRVTQTNDWQDANGRTERWNAGIEYWFRNPIFGSGFRSYAEGPYLQTENLYIHLLASAGLAAFVPFVWMLFILMRDSLRVFRQLGTNPGMFIDRGQMAVLWGGVVSYFFMAYFGSGIEGHPISNFTLFTLMGAILGSQLPWLAKPAALAVSAPNSADPAVRANPS